MTHDTKWTSLRTLSRKSRDFSVEIADYPRRNEKNLRNFHFILPKFHFPVPWGKFVCSLEFSDFLGRNWTQRRCKSRCKAFIALRSEPQPIDPLVVVLRSRIQSSHASALGSQVYMDKVSLLDVTKVNSLYLWDVHKSLTNRQHG